MTTVPASRTVAGPIVFATMSAPSAEGHGGNHRSYQIERDLGERFGAVTTLRLADGAGAATSRERLAWRRRRLADVLRNRRRLRGGSDYSPRAFLTEAAIARYHAAVTREPRPALTVTDHTGIAAGILPLNERLGIPTVIAPQNLESLDWARPGGLSTSIVDLADELSILSRCAARLCISKVEAGLLGGVGLPSTFYPYRPVGEIEDRLLAIRARRPARREPGLLLLLGSALHRSTGEAFSWLLDLIRDRGLPPGTRLAVAGQKTDALLAEGHRLPCVDLLGRVPQDVLDDLLVRATAVLVPQRRGFGALTRLPELSCAGIPAVVSEHACLAVDVPPGARRVPDDRDAWHSALAEAPALPPPALDAYVAWRDAQNGLPAALAD